MLSPRKTSPAQPFQIGGCIEVQRHFASFYQFVWQLTEQPLRAAFPLSQQPLRRRQRRLAPVDGNQRLRLLPRRHRGSTAFGCAAQRTVGSGRQQWQIARRYRHQRTTD